MSEENVQVARRWTEAYNRRDSDGLVLSEETFSDRGEALEAAGLSE
jgi:hypothetical protein